LDFFPELESTYWKQTNDQEKYELFELKIKPKIPKDLTVSQLQLKTFEMSGIKQRSFQFLLNQETFTFIPAARSVILGWDNGGNDEILREVLLNAYDDLVESAEREKRISGQNFNDWINEHTTNLRKVNIPPMIVSKYASPASASFLGTIDPITGTFKGNQELFSLYQPQIRDVLFPKLSFAESLSFRQPDTYLFKGGFYLELFPFTEKYRVYAHQPMTMVDNISQINRSGFQLLSENEWEYVVGAGCRKLFRFDTQQEVAALLSQDNLYQKTKITEVENMFGLVIDTTGRRFELTNNPFCLKLTSEKSSGNIVRDILPLATYYQSHQSVSMTELLLPERFSYRKMINLAIKHD
jgi:hypothetical protein